MCCKKSEGRARLNVPQRTDTRCLFPETAGQASACDPCTFAGAPHLEKCMNTTPTQDRAAIVAGHDLDSSNTRPNIVTGLFHDRSSAERAYDSVAGRGYDKKDVNLVMSDATRKAHFADDSETTTDLGSKAAQGAGVGGAIGSTLGAIVAAVAAVGTSVAIPGLGLVIAGPIAAALAGAGAGGVSGGLVGALVGWNIPEDRIKVYQEGIDNGGILLGVNPRSAEDAAYFEREWNSQQGSGVQR